VNLPFLELPQLLPKVLDWVETQEKLALNQGSALSPAALNDARAAGVHTPENIRVCVVSEIPQPEHPRIKQLAAELGLITSHTVAITFGFGIFVRTEQSHDRETLVHEFVHVVVTPSSIEHRCPKLHHAENTARMTMFDGMAHLAEGHEVKHHEYGMPRHSIALNCLDTICFKTVNRRYEKCINNPSAKGPETIFGFSLSCEIRCLADICGCHSGGDGERPKKSIKKSEPCIKVVLMQIDI